MSKKGHIKWFRDSYGFILDDNEDINYFLHISAWDEEELPQMGEEVEFDIEKTEKGYRAINCRRVNIYKDVI